MIKPGIELVRLQKLEQSYSWNRCTMWYLRAILKTNLAQTRIAKTIISPFELRSVHINHRIKNEHSIQGDVESLHSKN